MTRLVALLLVAAFTLQTLLIQSAAFSVAPPFGMSLASVMSRRANRRKGGDRIDAPQPPPTPLRAPPSPSLADPSLVEFNQLCRQAIEDERRRHYYPTVREISLHDRQLASSA
jgi:hypothetical protein